MGLAESYKNRKRQEAKRKAEKFWKDRNNGKGCMLSFLFILFGLISLIITIIK